MTRRQTRLATTGWWNGPGAFGKEAMEISRHKTRNVFDRYHIVSSKRQKQLGERLERHLQKKMPI